MNSSSKLLLGLAAVAITSTAITPKPAHAGFWDMIKKATAEAQAANDKHY